ncbi:MAG TPA: DUF2934 domain-containing protein [Candidatus Binataceae bacterium]|nr:DUF2934 domain-containing protein [Candidatus Binataceae bacterium]
MATQRKTKAPTVRKVKTSVNGNADSVAAVQSVAVPPIAVFLPTEEEVRVRAYELFLARGCKHGADLADWFAAEHELMDRLAVRAG